MRDINQVERRTWEDRVSQLQRGIEQQRFDRANQFYGALEDTQAALTEIRIRQQELEASNEELRATTEELEASNEELRATTEELEATADEMERIRERLTRSNADLEQFASVASHDLQEPLRMVSSYLQLLIRRYGDRLDADAAEFIRYAVDGASRMQAMINDLLRYSRLSPEANDFQPVDCEAVLGQATTNLHTAIEENGAVITRDPLPAITANANQLVQVFQNLIGNAIKFRSQEPPRIHMSAQPRGNEWLFSVRDNGIGIDPQYHERIFGLFRRLHTREEYPGTGIGLAVCKKIVERLGGRIWVESELGKGSTFYFTIPGTG
jgi:light-regulated signal transduction histidine kinase (bacteriophytochrome)